MVVSLDHLLTLAGRLDDARGFDSARERFRRFLNDTIRDVETLRSLVAECQHAPGEQHRIALQDIVSCAGRFLGFDVLQDLWRSPQLSVVIDVRSSDSADGIVGALAHHAAVINDGTLSGRPAIGLAVLTSLSPGREKIDDAVAAAAPGVRIVAIAIETLLLLAELAQNGQLSHEDIARLLQSGVAIDFVVKLLGRSADGDLVVEHVEAAESHLHFPRQTPVFWLVSVVPDQGMSADQFLELVVARRYVFGIGESAPDAGPVQTGDALCFHIAGKGVVGHARVLAIMEEGGGIRDARRFRQILRLVDVTLNRGLPVPLDPETELRLRAIPVNGRRQAQTLLGISRECFAAMTAPVDLDEDETETAAS